MQSILAYSRAWRTMLAATCAIFLTVVASHAETYYVSTNGLDANTGIGGWENAVENIATAIIRANQSDDTVWLSNGTHYIAGELTVNLDITLRGYTTNAADTVIDGGYPGQENRCLTLDHAGALVRDLTIQHGFYNVTLLGGGGVYIVSGGTISNCIVTANRCLRQGGGIHIAQNGLVVDSLIIDNHSVSGDGQSRGGGMYIATTGLVDNCRIADNTAYYAGGVYISQNGTIRNTFVVDNQSTMYGGGISVAVNGHVLDSYIIGNHATNNSTAAYGGGIAVLATAGDGVLVDGCQVVSNKAYDAAGIRGHALTVIRNCQLLDNEAIRNGGGGEGGQYFDCTITGNKASTPDVGTGSGGGLNVPHGVFDCTIASNFARYYGGGMYIRSVGSSETIVVSNCFIASNNSHAIWGAGIALRELNQPVDIVGCVISNNYHAGGVAFGGGGIGADIMADVIRVVDCVIVDNTSVGWGGGIWFRAADPAAAFELRNSLIAGNSSDNDGGGVYLDIAAGGTLESCTIMNNEAAAGKVAGLWGPDAVPHSVVNSIVYDNVTGGDTVWNYPATAALFFTNSCVYPLPTNADNCITNAPVIVDAVAGNFRLQAGSPCVNRGVYRDWMEGAKDLDERPRIDRFSGLVDIGCCEYISRGTLYKLR